MLQKSIKKVSEKSYHEFVQKRTINYIIYTVIYDIFSIRITWCLPFVNEEKCVLLIYDYSDVGGVVHDVDNPTIWEM